MAGGEGNKAFASMAALGQEWGLEEPAAELGQAGKGGALPLFPVIFVNSSIIDSSPEHFIIKTFKCLVKLKEFY